MASVRQVRQVAAFAVRLHGERARGQYDAYVRRDLFTRLRHRPGRMDPYPIYDQIRARGPLVTTRMGNLASADHELCSAVLRNRRFGVRPEAEEGEAVQDDFDLSFLERNPPDHTRLRRLAAPAFGSRQTAGYAPLIEACVDGLLDRASGAGVGGPVDLVGAYAAPLPIAVITELLGVPDADAEEFSSFGRVIGSALSGITSLAHARALMAANRDLEHLFIGLFALRRADPRADLISRLVAEQEEQLTPSELVAMCTLLLIAGFETTVNLVGNAVNALLDHPEQWQRLVADPSLAGAAVVETLRFDAPVQRTVRISFDDTELGGQPVRREQYLHLLLGGANRDPAVFERPHEFDLTRADAGEHLAFSGGIHHCLGRPLAELEATVALRSLAERAPGLRRAGGVRRRNATLIRGPLTLPVTLA